MGLPVPCMTQRTPCYRTAGISNMQVTPRSITGKNFKDAQRDEKVTSELPLLTQCSHEEMRDYPWLAYEGNHVGTNF